MIFAILLAVACASGPGAAAEGADEAVLAHAEPALRLDGSLGTLLRASDAEDAAARARNALFAGMSEILPTRDTLRGLVAEVGDGLFAGGDARLTDEARASIARLCDILAAHPTLNLRIEGRAGVDTPDRRLSTARAFAVRDVLVARGVLASRIAVVSLGAERFAGRAAGRVDGRRLRLVVAGDAITPGGA